MSRLEKYRLNIFINLDFSTVIYENLDLRHQIEDNIVNAGSERGVSGLI